MLARIDSNPDAGHRTAHRGTLHEEAADRRRERRETGCAFEPATPH